jgi:hypothetical protein
VAGLIEAGAYALLEGVGVGASELDAIIAESAEVKAAVHEMAERVCEYWKSIAPVGPHAHALKSGYVDEPGDYRDSINIVYATTKTGFFTAIVGTNDYKAHWLEYGSIHNPVFGYAQKTVDAFGGNVLGNGGGDGYLIGT